MGRGDLPDACVWAQGQAAHEPEGMQHPGANMDISGKSILFMLQCYVILNVMVTILTFQYHVQLIVM